MLVKYLRALLSKVGSLDNKVVQKLTFNKSGDVLVAPYDGIVSFNITCSGFWVSREDHYVMSEQYCNRVVNHGQTFQITKGERYHFHVEELNTNQRFDIFITPFVNSK